MRHGLKKNAQGRLLLPNFVFVQKFAMCKPIPNLRPVCVYAFIKPKLSWHLPLVPLVAVCGLFGTSTATQAWFPNQNPYRVFVCFYRPPTAPFVGTLIYVLTPVFSWAVVCLPAAAQKSKRATFAVLLPAVGKPPLEKFRVSPRADFMPHLSKTAAANDFLFAQVGYLFFLPVFC